MKNRSFTLLELIIIIVIAGILATLGLFSYERSVEDARWKEAVAVVKTIGTAVTVMKINEGDYVGIEVKDTNWNPNIGYESNASWERLGMKNPNGPREYFAFDFFRGQYDRNGTGECPGCPDPYAGSPRVFALVKGGGSGADQYITMNIATGKICVHRNGHCDYQ